LKDVLVTGAAGFLGRNLLVGLGRRKDVAVRTFDVEDARGALVDDLLSADVVYHLAGVNRPEREVEFELGNSGLTRDIVAALERFGHRPVIVMPSSTQAEFDNPYGRSKEAAENSLLHFSERTGSPVCIYRLPGVFGKWSRPNYNTVVATFCHNIARGLEITISDPARELDLVYVDDVVAAFLKHLDDPPDPARQRYSVPRSFRVTLGELAERIRRLNSIRQTLEVPDFSDELNRCLHATFISFLPEDEFSYPIKLNSDERGSLFELIKSPHFGQIFVSRTLPGVTRGNHYHDSKIEKFCVIVGQGVIRFRRIGTDQVIEYPVDDREIKVVDIPPGYTHSIENNGARDMICLFWANQLFNPGNPDTHFSEVKR
jgi:UDP-2-acetamido-2,6-beta-L-arabino-hexul-4-ose reductase